VGAIREKQAKRALSYLFDGRGVSLQPAGDIGEVYRGQQLGVWGDGKITEFLNEKETPGASADGVHATYRVSIGKEDRLKNFVKNLLIKRRREEEISEGVPQEKTPI